MADYNIRMHQIGDDGTTVHNLYPESKAELIKFDDGKSVQELRSSLYYATLGVIWTGNSAPYSQVVNISGVLSTDSPIIDMVNSGTYDTDTSLNYEWSKVYRAVAGNGIITFYSRETTSTAIPIQIVVVR